MTTNGCPNPCPCPCHTDVEDPGPHVEVCAFADPNYTPPDFLEAGKEIGAAMRDAVREVLEEGTPAAPESGVELSPWQAMHPNGACTCAGEGRCEWCIRTFAAERAAHPLRLVGAPRGRIEDRRLADVRKLRGAIEFARREWRNDGAEGETVHLLADALEVRLGPEDKATTVRNWEEARAAFGIIASEPVRTVGAVPAKVVLCRACHGGRGPCTCAEEQSAAQCETRMTVGPVEAVRCQRKAHDDDAHDFRDAPLEKRADRRPWFLSLEGRQFFYDDPESYPFTVTEIAHALANLCRFAGHLDRFYSVAEHSVYVAHLVHNEGRAMGIPDADLFPLCRSALLHDASEAFLMDLPRPLKRLPEMAPYRVLEDRVQLAILRRFGLEHLHDRDVIKRADGAMLKAEKIALRPVHGFQEYDHPVKAAAIVPLSLSPREARDMFVGTWRDYGGAA